MSLSLSIGLAVLALSLVAFSSRSPFHEITSAHLSAPAMIANISFDQNFVKAIIYATRVRD